MAGPACAGPLGHIELSSTSVDDPEMQLAEVSVYEHIQYRNRRAFLEFNVTPSSSPTLGAIRAQCQSVARSAD